MGMVLGKWLAEGLRAHVVFWYVGKGGNLFGDLEDVGWNLKMMYMYSQGTETDPAPNWRTYTNRFLPNQ